MSGIEVSCPICQLVFVTDRAYADHLADAHGLVDDEGTTTTVAEAAAAAPNDAAVQAAAVAVLARDEGPSTIDPSRIYDPDAHNPYRPAVAALLILVLLLGGGLAAVRSLGAGQEDAEAAQPLAAFLGDVEKPSGPGETDRTSLPTPDASSTTLLETTTTSSTLPPPPPAPAPARAPAPAPAPAPPPPPPPAFVAPTVSGLSLDVCPPNRGSGGTWRFSYVLSGGSSWTASPTATLISGRYYETRDTRFRDISVTHVTVVNALTGAPVALDVADLTEDNCP